MRRLLAVAMLAAALNAVAADAPPRLPPVTDPPSTVSIPGKFIWFDLVTPDAAASREFYGKVFGWAFQTTAGADDYTVFAASDRLIGGLYQPPAGGAREAGARWLAFASVRDMRATMARLGGMGFTTLLPATRVPDRGTHAIVRDPQGAIVGLLQSSSGDPRDEPVASGEFFWVDLYARDVATAAAAYAAIGYEVTPASDEAGERMLLASNGYARAGIAKLPPEGRQPGWLPYVQVEDVAATVAAAEAAGGRLLLEPDPDLLHGNVAVIGDPQGGIIGVIHWTQADDAEARP